MTRRYRSGSYGPEAGQNFVAALDGLNGSSPQSLVNLPANHTPGLYLLSINVFRRVAAGAGTMTVTHGWTYPDFGATTAVRGSFALNGTGPSASPSPLLIPSSGATAITTSLTFAGVTGSPVFDVLTTLEFLAELE